MRPHAPIDATRLDAVTLGRERAHMSGHQPTREHRKWFMVVDLDFTG